MGSQPAKASALRLIKKYAQWRKRSELKDVPQGLRGIYALHRKVERQKNEGQKIMETTYIGMAARGEGIRGRLIRHDRNDKHWSKWDHFSILGVGECARR